MKARPESDQVIRRVLVALLVAGVVTCCWQGWRLWDKPPPSANVSAAAHRDDATEAGRDALIAFNTLDHRRIDSIMNHWEALSTGSLHKQVMAGRTVVIKAVGKAKTLTSARVVQSGLTAFDDSAGTATLAAAVKIGRTDAKTHRASSKQIRVACLLQRIGGVWKISSIQTLKEQS